jgi:hypothetical protein
VHIHDVDGSDDDACFDENNEGMKKWVDDLGGVHDECIDSVWMNVCVQVDGTTAKRSKTKHEIIDLDFDFKENHLGGFGGGPQSVEN